MDPLFPDGSTRLLDDPHIYLSPEHFMPIDFKKKGTHHLFVLKSGQISDVSPYLSRIYPGFIS